MGNIEHTGKIARYFNHPHIIFAAAIICPSIILGIALWKNAFSEQVIVQIYWGLLPIIAVALIAYLAILVFKNHLLYAPTQFKDEQNFMKLQGRINDLEELPMIKYATKLTAIGKSMILSLYEKPQSIYDIFDEFREKHTRQEIEIQVEILKKFGWIAQDGTTLKITEKGRKDLLTFLDFVYARIAPDGWGD